MAGTVPQAREIRAKALFRAVCKYSERMFTFSDWLQRYRSPRSGLPVVSVRGIGVFSHAPLLMAFASLSAVIVPVRPSKVGPAGGTGTALWPWGEYVEVSMQAPPALTGSGGIFRMAAWRRFKSKLRGAARLGTYR